MKTQIYIFVFLVGEKVASQFFLKHAIFPACLGLCAPKGPWDAWRPHKPMFYEVEILLFYYLILNNEYGVS